MLGGQGGRRVASALIAGVLAVSLGVVVKDAATIPAHAAEGQCLVEIDSFMVRDVTLVTGVFGGYLWFPAIESPPSEHGTWRVATLDGGSVADVPLQPSVEAPDGAVWGWIRKDGYPMGIVRDGATVERELAAYEYVAHFDEGRAFAVGDGGIHLLDYSGDVRGFIPDVEPVQTVIGARANSSLSQVDVHDGRVFVRHTLGEIDEYDLNGNFVASVPAPPSSTNRFARFEVNAAGIFAENGGGLHHFDHNLVWTSVVDQGASPFDWALPDGIGRYLDMGDSVVGFRYVGGGASAEVFAFAGNGSSTVFDDLLPATVTTMWRVGDHSHFTSNGALYAFDRQLNLIDVTGEVGVKADIYSSLIDATDSYAISYAWGSGGDRIEAFSPDGILLGRVSEAFQNVGRHESVVVGTTQESYPDATVAVFDVSGCGWDGTFMDDDRSVFENDIVWMAEQGITKGCNPPANNRFCPDSVVTRGQMAAFLVRALGLTDRLDNPFIDDDGSVFEADIERLAAAGITKGCNPPANDRFCPDGKVTREQMAAFLVRALGYTDPGAGDLFSDDDLSIFEADIDRLATAGVTKGCNPPTNDRFCPTGYVTRGQMAAFLHRALG